MMWDFTGGQSNSRYRSATPVPPPMNMPSPGFLAPQDYSRGGPPQYHGQSYLSPPSPNRQHRLSMPSLPFESHLTVPQMPMIQHAPSADYAHVHHSHHSHHHHHQHHKRTHSQPPPPRHMVSQPVLTHHGYTSSQMNLHAPVAQDHQAQQTLFRYSKCSGKKKALCIGINYLGQENTLRGCINDARHVRDFLISRHGFRSKDIVMLRDDSRNPRSIPTKRNMLDAMRWLVADAQPDDSLFFHYSGHGGQTPDRDGDEIDGFDEVIFPVDFKKKGQITDDTMHDIMVKPLPPGCRLTALFDCCHSGTVLDLPYIYDSRIRLRGAHVTSKARKRKGTDADVISWSGCEDHQKSADTFHGNKAVGAMSHAFIKSLTENPQQSYKQLLRSVREILHPRFNQKPQLGSSHHIDTNLRFVI